MTYTEHLAELDHYLHPLLMHAYAALGAATSCAQVEAVLAQVETIREELDELRKTGVVRSELERHREDRQINAPTSMRLHGVRV